MTQDQEQPKAKFIREVGFEKDIIYFPKIF